MQISNGINDSLVNKPMINNKLQKNSAKMVNAKGTFPVKPRKLMSFAQKSEAAISLKCINFS